MTPSNFKPCDRIGLSLSAAMRPRQTSRASTFSTRFLSRFSHERIPATKPRTAIKAYLFSTQHLYPSLMQTTLCTLSGSNGFSRRSAIRICFSTDTRWVSGRSPAFALQLSIVTGSFVHQPGVSCLKRTGQHRSTTDTQRCDAVSSRPSSLMRRIGVRKTPSYVVPS